MYLNYLDLFSARIDGEDGASHRFVHEEYESCLGDTATGDVRMNVVFAPDRMQDDEYVVRAPVSYDERGVYIFDRERRKARIDFSRLGQESARLECDPDFHPPFFAILVEFIAHVEAFRTGRFFCHAAGVVHRGRAVLCPAWRNVGKTNTLLAFLLDKDTYLADDWCLLDAEGVAVKIPKRMCLFDYNLLFHPDIADRVDPTLRPLIEFYAGLLKGDFEVNDECLHDIRERLRLRVHPEQLFPGQVMGAPVQVDGVFSLVRNVRDPERGVYARVVERDALVRRVVEVLRFEQRPFRLAYAIYKARTGAPNALLEAEAARLPALVQSAFAAVPTCYEVRTPGQEGASDVKAAIVEAMERGSHAF